METLGEVIYKNRMDRNLTQDEYGSRYSVSGPAIFKFEKGYVRPSLELWLQIARDSSIPERRAVLMWLRAKLPREYQDYIEMPAEGSHRPARTRENKKDGRTDYASFEEHTRMRSTAVKDKSLPKGLRELLDDDELWTLYKPTGHEINMLREMFSSLGEGSKNSYREGLRLVREFSHSF